MDYCFSGTASHAPRASTNITHARRAGQPGHRRGSRARVVLAAPDGGALQSEAVEGPRGAAPPQEGCEWLGCTRFELLREPTANAFAAPGGLVVVQTGLLVAAESADEVAGILAHEVAHVAARHSLRQILFQLGLVASLRLVLGDQTGQAVGSAVTQLGSLRFSRDQERDADRRAVELLARARLPAAGLQSFFDRLARRDGAVPALLSSHPPTAERAAALARLIDQRGRWPTEPPALDWNAVRRDARGVP
jgi:predicted Zn-dependent protease